MHFCKQFCSFASVEDVQSPAMKSYSVEACSFLSMIEYIYIGPLSVMSILVMISENFIFRIYFIEILIGYLLWMIIQCHEPNFVVPVQ